MEKILKGLQFNMSFAPISDIRERVFKREDEFRRYFRNGFSVAALPPNAPLDVPRFFAINDGKKLTCVISGKSLNLSQQQEGKFSVELSDFIGLAMQICNTFFEIVSLDKVEFCGIAGNVWIEVDDGTLFVREKFLNIGINEIFDVAVRMTKVIEGTYYANLSCSNLRTSQDDNKFVSVDIDVNDRYRHNFGHINTGEKFNETLDKLCKLFSNEISVVDGWMKE